MSDNTQDHIAVIGMSCRFPGAKTVREFWRNLCEGKESIVRFSDRDLLASGVEAETLNDPNYVKAGSIVEDYDKFDASFFGINSREAERMDPQQRLFLQSVWECFEDGGFVVKNSADIVGVFSSSNLSTYLYYMLKQDPRVANDVEVLLGNDKDNLSLRTSALYDLKGPSYSIQSNCSSSLVCIHVACQNLLDYSCDVAVVGSSTISVPHKVGYWKKGQELASADGHCRPFDASSNGTVFGNGVGVVLLKRLDDAVRDANRVYAVVRGSAVNNNGKVKGGYSVPSAEGQTAVIRDALASAEIDASQVSFIEAHGSGTTIGDSIEVSSLGKIYCHKTKLNPCWLGSVKGNIGHLDATSGIASFIKVVLSLYYRKIAPNLHFREPIDILKNSRFSFEIPISARQWGNEGELLFSGINGYAIGGTNIHALLSSFENDPNSSSSRSKHILLFSAKSESALEKQLENLGKFLQENSKIDLVDVAYTLRMGRSFFSFRKVVIAENVDEGAKLLLANHSDPLLKKTPSQEPKVVFIFSETKRPDFIKVEQCYRTESAFRSIFDECCRCSKAFLDFDLKKFTAEVKGGSRAPNLNLKSSFEHSVWNFVVQLSIVEMFSAWGVSPCLTIGDELGKITAACVSGLLSVEDSLLKIKEYYFSNDLQTASDSEYRVKSEQKLDFWDSSNLTIPIYTIHNNDIIKIDEIIDVNSSQLSEPSVRDALDYSSYNSSIFIDFASGELLLEWIVERFKCDRGRVLSTNPDVGLELTDSIYSIVGQLWSAGVTIDWLKFGEDETASIVSLPTYPFKKEKHWFGEAKGENVDNQPSSIPADFVGPETVTEKVIAKSWAKLLGIEKVGREDNFFELGGNSMTATQALNELSQIYKNSRLELVDLFSSPTIYSLAKQIDESAKPVRMMDKEVLLKMSKEERIDWIKQWVLKTEKSILNQDKANRRSIDTIEIDEDVTIAALIWEIRRDFDIRMYPHEFRNDTSIKSWTLLIEEEISRALSLELGNSFVDVDKVKIESLLPLSKKDYSKYEDKNPSMVFIHSAPRSGSTLLRVLLNGHPKLFCPGEFGLLAADNLKEWGNLRFGKYTRAGLVGAYRELKKLQSKTAESYVNNLVEENSSTKEIYKNIQSLLGKRLLIDKTPIYGISQDVLKRSEDYFHEPKYIHLIRHPYCVVNSFVKNRFHKFFTQEEVEPYRFADRFWSTCENNFRCFYANVDENRVLHIKFEDLVGKAEETMKSIVDFLGIDFDKSLLNPYIGNRNMGGFGDPDFYNHKQIDEEQAKKWNTIRLPIELSNESLNLASSIGYHLHNEIDHKGLNMPNLTTEEINNMSESDLDLLLGLRNE